MAQVKIYGLAHHLNPIKSELSEVIHECVVEALSFPADKRFHRFFSLDAEDFIFHPTAATDIPSWRSVCSRGAPLPRASN
jgi:hypothetical protein